MDTENPVYRHCCLSFQTASPTDQRIQILNVFFFNHYKGFFKYVNACNDSMYPQNSQLSTKVTQ